MPRRSYLPNSLLALVPYTRAFANKLPLQMVQWSFSKCYSYGSLIGSDKADQNGALGIQVEVELKPYRLAYHSDRALSSL